MTAAQLQVLVWANPNVQPIEDRNATTVESQLKWWGGKQFVVSSLEFFYCLYVCIDWIEQPLVDSL
jgi:hypothetical protein